jgi:hypothetical protein
MLLKKKAKNNMFVAIYLLRAIIKILLLITIASSFLDNTTYFLAKQMNCKCNTPPLLFFTVQYLEGGFESC